MWTSAILIDMPKRHISDTTTEDTAYANYRCYKNGDPVLMELDGEKQWSTPSTVLKIDPRNQSYVVKTGAGIRYRRNRRHLQGVPRVVPPVPDDEPDDTDIPADPGDAVVPPVDVPAGPNTPLMYTRSGRAVRRP